MVGEDGWGKYGCELLGKCVGGIESSAVRDVVTCNFVSGFGGVVEDG